MKTNCFARVINAVSNVLGSFALQPTMVAIKHQARIVQATFIGSLRHMNRELHLTMSGATKMSALPYKLTSIIWRKCELDRPVLGNIRY